MTHLLLSGVESFIITVQGCGNLVLFLHTGIPAQEILPYSLVQHQIPPPYDQQ